MWERLTKEERDKLAEELGELSQLGNLKMDRMREIAHILVQDYLHRNDKDEWNSQKKI